MICLKRWICTVNVQIPNLRIRNNAERFIFWRVQNLNVRNLVIFQDNKPNAIHLFEIETSLDSRCSLYVMLNTYSGMLKSEPEIRTICSDFGQKISSEIQTIRFERSDFGIIGILMLWMLKSERSHFAKNQLHLCTKSIMGMWHHSQFTTIKLRKHCNFLSRRYVHWLHSTSANQVKTVRTLNWSSFERHHQNFWLTKIHQKWQRIWNV